MTDGHCNCDCGYTRGFNDGFAGGAKHAGMWKNKAERYHAKLLLKNKRLSQKAQEIQWRWDD